MPFSAPEPPMTRPRGQYSRRPAQPSWSSVWWAQSTSERASSGQRPGSWIAGLVAGPPASTSATVAPPSSSRRAAAHPAEPPPTTT